MNIWTGPEWANILAQHRAEYSKEEEARIERACKLYRGDPWSPEDRARRDDKSGGTLRLVTYNLAFAIIESSISSVVPSNLQFTVYTGDQPDTSDTGLEKLLAKCDRIENWGYEATLSMLDALLTGRSILKTVPGERTPGTVRAVDPRKVFFDLAARRPQDIGYFIELTPMPRREFEDKLRRRGNKPALYKLPEGTDIKGLASGYPSFLSEAAHRTAGQEWIAVFEVVDTKRKQVSHWVDGIQEPLAVWEGKDYYNPYTLYNLHINGLDCRGMSEVILVEDIICTINRLLTYWAELVRKLVPVTIYDNTATTEDEVKKVGQATPSAIVGLALNGRPVNAVIGNLALPSIPPEIDQLITKLESIVSFVTGLSDSARGQITGARTATDLAVAEAANKTRIGHRSTRYMRAWEDSALKVLVLAKSLDRRVPDVDDVVMVAYSPIEKNREVLRDRFKEAWATMVSKPDAFNQEEIDKLFVEVYNLPRRVLLTPEQKAAMAAPPPPPASAVTAGDVAPTGQAEAQQEVPDPIPASVSNKLPEAPNAGA